MYNITMTTDDLIKDEKLQYDVNREAAKIPTFSSGKINKYEYLTDEEILPSNQNQIIEQAKFTYSALGKTFEKQIKTIQGRSQNLKQVPQNFMKVFDVDEVTQTLQVMTSYREINIATENILSYSYFKFTSQLEKDWNFGYVFSISKTRTRSCQSFFFYKELCIIRQ